LVPNWWTSYFRPLGLTQGPLPYELGHWVEGPPRPHFHPLCTMRRSGRRSIIAPKKHADVGHGASPSSASEVTLSDATPSVSPMQELAKRQHGTPAQRDRDAPKRPMNAFILFSNEMRSKLADRNPTLSNAAVSVLLGQQWRDMHASQKSGYVNAARKIKEQFHIDHPDAKRHMVRKGKRKRESSAVGGEGIVARNLNPPSLQALALVGSRLNQSDDPLVTSPGGPSPARLKASFDDHSDGDEYGQDDELFHSDEESQVHPEGARHLTLLEQHAAEALSAFREW